MKQLWHNLLADRHREHAIRTLRKLEEKLPSREARFAVPFAYRGKGHFRSMRMQQSPQEIEAMYRRICEHHPRVVVEVGTAKGGTLYLWSQAAIDDATLISIDIPYEGQQGYIPCRAALYESFARPGQTLRLMRADSHAQSTLAELKALLHGQPVDFLFIDGDHTYAGVKQDFEMYSPLVRSGGLVGFHDILPNDRQRGIEVDRFWRELREQYEVEEFIASANAQRRIGIGLVKLP